MLTHTIPWTQGNAISASGVMRRCAGPNGCTAGYCFNGLHEDELARQESNEAAKRRGWRQVNAGWICPDCAATL